MRITNSMMIMSTVRNLNANMQRLSKAQTQMATQSKIQLPSDDPVAAARAVKYRYYLSGIEQYQKNVDDALAWQQITDSALSDLTDVVQQIRDYAVQASTDTLTDADKAQIKISVEQLKEQVVEIMNTSYSGRYIFGGYVTDEKPYTVDASPSVGARITFKGKYMNLSGPMSSAVSDADIIAFVTANANNSYESQKQQNINYNIGYGSEVSVNVEGIEVIGIGADNNLFDSIDKLLIGLNGETTYKTAEFTSTTPTASVTITEKEFEIDEVLDYLDKDIDRILAAQADLGARMKYVTMAKERLSSDYSTYINLISKNQDIDVAEASMEVSTAQYVYEASLSVGAKIISKTLVDYLG